MIVSQPREVLWAFVNTRVGVPWSEDFRAVGAVRGDCLKAVVAYNGFTGRVCFMHSAIDDPAVIDRTFVRAIFEFPFLQCGLTHVLAMVEEENTRAMDIDLRVGFKEKYRLSGASQQGGDLVILEMSKDECRWIRGHHGKEESSARAGLHSGSSSSGAVERSEHCCADVG